MKKYIYKEVADIVGISPSIVNSKTNSKKFSKKNKTTVVTPKGQDYILKKFFVGRSVNE